MMTSQTSADGRTPALLEERWTGPLSVHADAIKALAEWAGSRQSWIDEALITHGAILFKKFALDGRATFHDAADSLCDELLDYVYRSTPRTAVGDRVFTATEYRASAAIPFHNENAYQRDWPMRLVFGCLRPATSGGETGLASTRRVTARIDPEVVARFARKGVTYVRNYRPGIDLTWQEVFQTEHRAEVEAYCLRYGIEYEWLSAEHLRTRQVCEAVVAHPRTGERLWFNQAHLFHVSSLGELDASTLLGFFGEDGLPRHAYFGDGSVIDIPTLDHIREVYEAEAFRRPWEAGDVLLVDNMLVAHARSPYQGPREVLVAMGDAYRKYAATGLEP